MTKKKILLLHRKYPVSISHYFLTAFQHRDDVEVVDVSPHYGCSIPWNGGLTLPEKYRATPNYILPFDWPEVPWEIVDKITEFQKWDMVLNIDAGIHWTSKPNVKCPVVHVATDPHCLNYDRPREYSDFFFNMQKCYSKPGDIYLPYAFSKYHFYPEPETEKIYDASLVGLQYANRIAWVNNLRNRGMKVYFNNGDAYDEYRHITNQSKVVLSWSSKDDLICRVFEALGMGQILVTNVVPDVQEFFADGIHCLMFDGNLTNSVQDATWLVQNILECGTKDFSEMVSAAKDLVWNNHTFDHRVDQIMTTVFGEA